MVRLCLGTAQSIELLKSCCTSIGRRAVGANESTRLANESAEKQKNTVKVSEDDRPEPAEKTDQVEDSARKARRTRRQSRHTPDFWTISTLGDLSYLFLPSYYTLKISNETDFWVEIGWISFENGLSRAFASYHVISHRVRPYQTVPVRSRQFDQSHNPKFSPITRTGLGRSASCPEMTSPQPERSP